MTTVVIGKRRVQIPSSLNEFSTDLLFFLFDLLAEERPDYEIKAKLFLKAINARVMRFNGMEYYRLFVGWRSFKVSVQEFETFSSAFNFLFSKDEDGNPIIDNRLTQCPIHPPKGFSFPEEAMTNISYNQLVFLDSYIAIAESNPEAALHFVASMLLKNGRFVPEEIPLKQAKRLSPKECTALMWFYDASLRYIADKYPRLFGGTSSGNSSSAYDSHMKLLDYISHNDVVKKVQIKTINLYDVLASLDSKIEDSERQAKSSHHGL